MLDGVVTVQVKGPRLEEFINRCAARGIQLWKTERPVPGMLIANMRARAFRVVRHLARHQGWELRIVDRYGFAFYLHALLGRRAFVAGGVLALVAWYILSLFVWFVDVEGLETVPVERVRAAAAAAGLQRGRLVGALDRDVIANAVLLEVDELIWAAVEVEGTRVILRVAERTRVDPSLLPGPGHLIAAWDGVVTHVTVLSGTPLVEPGSVVRKGDLLISGMLQPGTVEYRERVEAGELPVIRAAGSVRARVWREAVVEVRPTEEAGSEEARQTALRLAREQVEAWLAEVEGRPLGDPVLEAAWVEEAEVWQARALLEAEVEIAHFLPAGGG